MNSHTVVGLTIACGFLATIQAFSLSVLFPPPPPQTSDSSNVSYVHDELGYLHKVDVETVINESLPFFSFHQDVRFELFTPKNPKEPQNLKFRNETSVELSNFDKSKPTRIFVHGWSSEGLLTPRFADAYFEKGKHDVNFIAVNWQKGSDTVNYFVARSRVTMLAEYIAKFIDFMVESANLELKDLTVIGHSLGAHVSGIVGKKITKGKIAKIVGLDPASPLFKFKDAGDRLADTDAEHVEVIHTSAGILSISQAMGTVDFYPNGGKSQPGCGWDMSGACSHGRAHEFYIESIHRPLFHAFQCDSYDNLQKGNCSVVNEVQRMGGEPSTNQKAKGVFYLETNAKAEFAQGMTGILKELIESEGDALEKKQWFWKNFGRTKSSPIAIVTASEAITGEIITNQDSISSDFWRTFFNSNQVETEPVPEITVMSSPTSLKWNLSQSKNESVPEVTEETAEKNEETERKPKLIIRKDKPVVEADGNGEGSNTIPEIVTSTSDSTTDSPKWRKLFKFSSPTSTDVVSIGAVIQPERNFTSSVSVKYWGGFVPHTDW